MDTPRDILNQYWGFTSFRPLQEDIVNAVLTQHDVLALLPTGGGKSICYQVPGLMREGICIVVSPLVSLIKDQVTQLQEKGIKAAAIYAGMTYKEIDVTLDNCVYGDIKFLYLSPERLKTDLFQARVKKMNVNLVAIDEAHCISQWGYDFRPAYLEISALRGMLPDVKFIALTATATKEVRQDIQDKLQFEQPKIFQQSFARDNLAYVVKKADDKFSELLKALRKVKGSVIVYTGARKLTRDIAVQLQKEGISADLYHAGLPHDIRNQKQTEWFQGKTQVIVATNAFGMGIDKPNVRLVVHMMLPNTLEAYYQEAGRAGRDQKRAKALVLYDELDLQYLNDQVEVTNPSIEFLRTLYQQLANFYQVAIGSHQLVTHDFDLEAFAAHYQTSPSHVYRGIKTLEREGLVMLNESYYQPAKVHFKVNQQQLYAFQVAQEAYDNLIKAILRLYGGESLGNYVVVSEERIAKLLNIPKKEVITLLQALDRRHILHYVPQKDRLQFTFLTPRLASDQLPLKEAVLQERKALVEKKTQAVVNYVEHSYRCRPQLLLEYFGEVSYEPCEKCGVCIDKRKEQSSPTLSVYDQYRSLILQCIDSGINEVNAIIAHINPEASSEIITTLRHMIDGEELCYNDQYQLLRSQQTEGTTSN